MNLLELVRAGAGSGKTTDLCSTVAEAVEKGLDPSRILATTFTNKAAAELKGRIQAALIARTDANGAGQGNADRFELAAIGTVHSVAHQLLSRYAIESGLSPRLEVITEIAGDKTLKNLLGKNSLSELQILAKRLGITDLHRRILKLLAAKRGNAISNEDFTSQMAASADRVCSLLVPSGRLGAETSVERLHQLAKEALTNIDRLVDDKQKNTNLGRQKLRQLGSKRLALWASYLFARGITAGKSSGADGMLDELRNHAAEVRQHPALHDDIREFSSLLAAETIRLDSQYTSHKIERGLIDFTDLEIQLLKLLQDETLAARLNDVFDLVLVDEFQDTNPLQLAIFLELRKFSPRSRWVGDPKQAIFGFRDADPDLVNNVWENTPETVPPMRKNFRSQRGLVQLVGRLFEPLFGDDAIQVPQKPKARRGIERWIFDTTRKQDDAMAMACGIAKLKKEGIRFGDIVVLEPRNIDAESVASALDALGIPYLLESPGLLSTREGNMVLAGLRLVADRRDSLAAATILHQSSDPETGTPEWVLQRIKHVRDLQEVTESDRSSKMYIPWCGDSRFSEIEKIDHSLLSPLAVIQRVIEALDLPSLVHHWGEPARRCSNLDSFLRHGQEYEESSVKNGQASTLSGLILYLEQLMDEKKDMCYPPQGHDAVTVMTYHSAKGLEWPVVVLSGLDFDRSSDMWSPMVTGGGGNYPSPLMGRNLRSWTWPFGKTEGSYSSFNKGSGLEDDALLSPEGEERSIREINEKIRLLYVGCTRAKQKLVFAHRDGKYSWLQRLERVDELLDPKLEEGEHELSGIDTDFVLRRLNAQMVEDYRFPVKQKVRWLALAKARDLPDSSPRFYSPSQAIAKDECPEFAIEELPGRPYFPEGAKENQYASIGDAVHRYLAAIPSMTSLDSQAKNAVAKRCLSAFSVSGLIEPSALVSSGERFVQWVDNHYPGAQWHVEMAASGPRSAGGDWSGTIDLMLQLPDGGVVVIDHKSAPIQRKYCAQKASQFAGQLEAYREILFAAGYRVQAEWIHFPLSGVVATPT